MRRDADVERHFRKHKREGERGLAGIQNGARFQEHTPADRFFVRAKDMDAVSIISVWRIKIN